METLIIENAKFVIPESIYGNKILFERFEFEGGFDNIAIHFAEINLRTGNNKSINFYPKEIDESHPDFLICKKEFCLYRENYVLYELYVVGWKPGNKIKVKYQIITNKNNQ